MIPEFFCSAAMFRRQTDTQIPSSSRSCFIKETALFLNTFACNLSHFTAFASLAVIDTVNPATSPVCSPSTIVTYPLETDLTSFQILSCLVSATVAAYITSRLTSCPRTHSSECSASDKSHNCCKYSPVLKKKPVVGRNDVRKPLVRLSVSESPFPSSSIPEVRS